MPYSRDKLKQTLKAGAKKGWASFIWICKILLPASLVVILIQWGGWLYRAEPFLTR